MKAEHEKQRLQKQLDAIEDSLRHVEERLISLTFSDHPVVRTVLEAQKCVLVGKFTRMYQRLIDINVAEVPE